MFRVSSVLTRLLRLSMNTAALAAVLGMLLYTLFVQWMLWSHTTDDAYITFRVIANWLQHGELTYNLGDRYEVFSNPLWVLNLAACQFLFGGDLVIWARALGLVYTALTFGGMYWIARQFNPACRTLAFVFGGLWCLTLPNLQVYASLGLEGPQMMALVTLAVAATLSANRPDENGLSKGQLQSPLMILAAMLFGLIGISRPEGPLYGLLWGCMLAWQSRHDFARHFPRLLSLAILTALPSVAWEAFRLGYYGSWLSGTWYAKPPNVFNFNGYELLFVNLNWLSQFLWFYLGTIFVVFTPRWRELKIIALWTFSVCVVLGLQVAVLLPMPKTIGTIAWLSPLLVLLIIFFFSRLDTGMRRQQILICLPAIAAGLCFHLYAVTDWMYFVRFLMPIFPVLIMAMLFPLSFSCAQIHWRLLLLMPFILIIGMHNITTVLAYIAEPHPIMRGEDIRTAAIWIKRNLPQTRTIASDTSGILGYEMIDSDVRDFTGITDMQQAGFVRAQPDFLTAITPRTDSPLWRRHPEVIVLASSRYPDFFYWKADGLAALETAYTCVHRVYLGKDGSLDIWLRSDISNRVSTRCR